MSEAVYRSEVRIERVKGPVRKGYLPAESDFNQHVPVHLHDRHASVVGQQVCEDAGMVRIEVLHQNERHSGVRRQIPEQLRERFQSSGGRPDTDD